MKKIYIIPFILICFLFIYAGLDTFNRSGSGALTDSLKQATSGFNWYRVPGQAHNDTSGWVINANEAQPYFTATGEEAYMYADTSLSLADSQEIYFTFKQLPTPRVGAKIGIILKANSQNVTTGTYLRATLTYNSTNTMGALLEMHDGTLNSVTNLISTGVSPIFAVGDTFRATWGGSGSNANSFKVFRNQTQLLTTTNTGFGSTTTYKPWIFGTVESTPWKIDNLIIATKGSSATPPSPPTRDTLAPQINYISVTPPSPVQNQTFTITLSATDLPLYQNNPYYHLANMKLYHKGTLVRNKTVANIGTDTVLYTTSESTAGTITDSVVVTDDSGKVTRQSFNVGINQNNGTSNFKVIAYYPEWSYPNNPVETFNFGLVTHLIYFAADVVDTSGTSYGYFKPLRSAIDSARYETNGYNYWQLIRLRDSAHAHGVKVTFSLTGVYNPRDWDYIVSDSTRTQRFVDYVVAWVQRKQLDGIDINWEFPTASTQSRLDVSRMLRRFRAALGANAFFSSTVYLFGQQSTTWVDATTINTYVDVLYPEMYGLAYNQANSQLGHTCALYPATCGTGQRAGVWSDSAAIGFSIVGARGFTGIGVQKSHLAMGVGVAAYEYFTPDGRTTLGVCDNNSGVVWIGGAPNASTSPNFTYGTPAYQDLSTVDTKYGVFTEQWDAVGMMNYKQWYGAASPTFSGFNSQVNGAHFLTYERPASVQMKVQWLKDNGYSAIMIYDTYQGQRAAGSVPDTLMRAIAATAFGGSPPASTPLAAPAYVSPANNTTGIARTNVTLTWNQVSTASGYTLQVGGDTNFVSTVVQITTVGQTDTQRTVTPSLLSDGVKYFWRLNSLNPTAGAWSTTRSFTTAPAVSQSAPSTPVLSTPANNATGVSILLGLKLIWNHTDTTTSYTLVYGSDTTSGLTTVTGITDTTLMVYNLSASTSYFWKVRSVNAIGSSAYSGYFKFTTSTAGTPKPPGSIGYIDPNRNIITYDAPPYYVTRLDQTSPTPTDTSLAASRFTKNGGIYMRTTTGESQLNNSTISNAQALTAINSANNTFSSVNTFSVVDTFKARPIILTSPAVAMGDSTTTFITPTQLAAATTINPVTSFSWFDDFIVSQAFQSNSNTTIVGLIGEKGWTSGSTIPAGVGFAFDGRGGVLGAGDTSRPGQFAIYGGQDSIRTDDSGRGGVVIMSPLLGQNSGQVQFRMRNGVYTFAVKTAATCDSNVFVIGLIDTTYAVDVSSRNTRGIYFEFGRTFSRAKTTTATPTDSIRGVVGLRTSAKIVRGLAPYSASTWYTLKIVINTSTADFYVNGFLRQSLDISGISGSTYGAPFFGIYNYDANASTTKQFIVDYYSLTATGLAR